MGNKPTAEFRQEVVRVALTSGLSRKQVASDFGIGFSTLSGWIKEERDTVFTPKPLLHLSHKLNWFTKTNGCAKKCACFVRSIRVGQVGFSVHVRSSRNRTLANTTSFLMIAVIATFGGFPRLII